MSAGFGLLSQQLFLALLYMARGGLWGYRRGRGVRRLRAEFGRLELLCLDHLTLPTKELELNFQPKQQAWGREKVCGFRSGRGFHEDARSSHFRTVIFILF